VWCCWWRTYSRGTLHPSTQNWRKPCCISKETKFYRLNSQILKINIDIYLLMHILGHAQFLSKNLLLPLQVASPLQSWTGPWDSRSLRIPEFIRNRNMEMVRLSVLGMGRLYLQKILLIFTFVRGWVEPRSYSADGRIKSMKNPINPFGNWTRVLHQLRHSLSLAVIRHSPYCVHLYVENLCFCRTEC